MSSFRELEQMTRAGLERALVASLGPNAQRTLERAAPESIQLPSSAKVDLRRVRRRACFAAAGLLRHGGIASHWGALVVHLLAPNRRPVQMTQDLAGFWERLYPQVRKELWSNFWPENPYNVYRD
ncbi:MAG: ATP-dependent helicase C-terminal domain-containing protein [Paludibaculum sp.]